MNRLMKVELNRSRILVVLAIGWCFAPKADCAVDEDSILYKGPLTARITVDIAGIGQQETLKADLSPVMIDAKEERRLTLKEVAWIAEKRNLPLLQSRALGKSAFYSWLGYAGLMNPLNASLNAVNINTGFPATPQAPGNNNVIDRERYGSYGVTLLNQGTSLFNAMSSYFNWRAVNASVQTNLQNAFFDSIRAYFTLCQQISLLHVADIVVENSRTIVTLNKELYESGLGTKLQFLQAETQLAQDRQNLVEQQVRARVAAINLAVVLNLPLSVYLLPKVAPLQKTTLVDPKLPVERLEAIALRARPEIVHHRNLVRQQVARTGLALSPMIPQASYVVQIGNQFPTTNPVQVQDAMQRTMVFQWQLNNVASQVPANFAAGVENVRAAQYGLQNTELHVRSGVREAYDRSLAFEKNIEIAREAAVEAQEQLRLAEERLAAGIGINIDVIQAQNSLTSALQNYVNAIYNYNIQQATLRRAIGGFSLPAMRSRLEYE